MGAVCVAALKAELDDAVPRPDNTGQTAAGAQTILKRVPIIIVMLFCAACSATEDQAAHDQAGNSCEGLAADDMVWIEGGSFVLGEDPLYREEGPPTEIEVEPFWISKTEVTNAQFARFVEATGYLTDAERAPPEIPGAPPEMLQPGSAVFSVPTEDNPYWWRWVVGASWRAPSGPGSGIEGKDNDPVVQVTYGDALAYAQWAGVSLPSEAQWEYAARAGAEALPEPIDASGRLLANYYQGVFPRRDTGDDGFVSRAPVGCFPANNYGLHDMIGNVWEWTASEPRAGAGVRTIKGGSFLCAANYCARYRPAARQYQELNLGTDHIGFRVVDTLRPPPETGADR